MSNLLKNDSFCVIYIIKIKEVINMKINEKKQEIKEILSKHTCRGCYNHCTLENPGCRKSKIWINEILEKEEVEK